ncbi:ATP-binding protein [Nitratireductor indicus]|uniref:ATP-binding protein n=1 Tax=Nitratireductor indicus TaxID=721133 RepID=UPI002876800C|nr:ATP-binding protein [Nitratireductor indicus]MDS1138063.1 ATP-binding protein [Nitratireductor indicus]
MPDRREERRPRWSIRYFAAGILLVIAAGFFSTLSAQLTHELARLRAAPSDNLQWTMAQVQVELLILEEALHDVVHNRSAPLDQVRQRFDIFYSRIDTLERGSMFAAVKAEPRAHKALGEIRDALVQSLPLIDGPDETLRAGIAELYERAHRLQPAARNLALEGVLVLARQADDERQEFTDLLLRMALVALIVFFAMLLALALFWRQSRVARRRSEELAISNLRYASAISTSLDPIIVSDAQGRILDINPAAEKVFGYMRETAVGSTMEELIIPPDLREAHRERLRKYLSGGNLRILRSERIDTEAMRASGKRFAAEFSFGVTIGNEGPIFTTYIRDISDRIRAQEALTAARDEALAMAKAKSDFLAVMSHEMRTPLNGVMGVLDVLLDTKLTRKQRDYVETGITSGEILQRHIDEVLDITRIEAGALKLRPSQFDVETLLREVQNINEQAALPRGNRIVTGTEPGLIVFAQDRHCLRQILMNLVSNAIKFTLNGEIRIEARALPEENGKSWAEFTVSDTGMGIKPEDMERIFEDFVMLDPSHRRTSPGSGLGLGISRRIATLMGGEITVESVPEKGSRFSVRIPALPTPATEETRSRRGRPHPPAARRQHGLSVLLVEDNETNRLVARAMLSKHGCRITEAPDGKVGVSLAHDTRFDLILMDISMPRLDGLRATQLIRAGDGLSKDAPIIGLTAHALPEEQRELKRAGMQDCIIKPLRSEKIAALLDRVTSQPRPTTEYQGTRSEHPLPSAVEPAQPALLDPATWAELQGSLPPALLEAQLKRFHKELDEIESLFTEENAGSLELEKLCRLAHNHAGTAAIFGAGILRQTLLDFETACKKGDIAFLSNRCRAVCEAARNTRDALISRQTDPV